MSLLLLFFLIARACGRLDIYFNLTGEHYPPIQHAAFEQLRNCSNTNLDWWESSIREGYFNVSACDMISVVKNCTYGNVNDLVANYLDLLIKDTTSVCRDIENEKLKNICKNFGLQWDEADCGLLSAVKNNSFNTQRLSVAEHLKLIINESNVFNAEQDCGDTILTYTLIGSGLVISIIWIIKTLVLLRFKALLLQQKTLSLRRTGRSCFSGGEEEEE